jgi:hypothetical protein
MSGGKLFDNKFEVYKTRFTKKEKVVRKELDILSQSIDQHRQMMAKGADVQGDSEILQQKATRIQTLVDELDEIMAQMHKLGDSKQTKSTILRFKNKV